MVCRLFTQLISKLQSSISSWMHLSPLHIDKRKLSLELLQPLLGVCHLSAPATCTLGTLFILRWWTREAQHGTVCIPDAQLHVGDYGSVRDFQCICWVAVVITHGEVAFVISSQTELTESHIPCEAWCESQEQSRESPNQQRRLVKGRDSWAACVNEGNGCPSRPSTCFERALEAACFFPHA